jgi:hypothetical protein
MRESRLKSWIMDDRSHYYPPGHQLSSPLANVNSVVVDETEELPKSASIGHRPSDSVSTTGGPAPWAGLDSPTSSEFSKSAIPRPASQASEIKAQMSELREKISSIKGRAKDRRASSVISGPIDRTPSPDGSVKPATKSQAGSSPAGDGSEKKKLKERQQAEATETVQSNSKRSSLVKSQIPSRSHSQKTSPQSRPTTSGSHTNVIAMGKPPQFAMKDTIPRNIATTAGAVAATKRLTSYMNKQEATGPARTRTPTNKGPGRGRTSDEFTDYESESHYEDAEETLDDLEESLDRPTNHANHKVLIGGTGPKGIAGYGYGPGPSIMNGHNGGLHEDIMSDVIEELPELEASDVDDDYQVHDELSHMRSYAAATKRQRQKEQLEQRERAQRQNQQLQPPPGERATHSAQSIRAQPPGYWAGDFSDPEDDDSDDGPVHPYAHSRPPTASSLNRNSVEVEDVFDPGLEDGIMSETTEYFDSAETPAERHEDREDAFDYENFFLHSAMGTYSREVRRGERPGSNSSDSDGGDFSDGESTGSVETTRPASGYRVRSDDGEDGMYDEFGEEGEKRKSLMDLESANASVATFQTARDGEEYDDGDVEVADFDDRREYRPLPNGVGGKHSHSLSTSDAMLKPGPKAKDFLANRASQLPAPWTSLTPHQMMRPSTSPSTVSVAPPPVVQKTDLLSYFVDYEVNNATPEVFEQDKALIGDLVSAVQRVVFDMQRNPEGSDRRREVRGVVERLTKILNNSVSTKSPDKAADSEKRQSMIGPATKAQDDRRQSVGSVRSTATGRTKTSEAESENSGSVSTAKRASMYSRKSDNDGTAGAVSVGGHEASG